MKHFFILVLTVFLWGCKGEKGSEIESEKSSELNYELDYATGFKIIKKTGYDVLEIKDPWPKSTKTYRYALIHASDKNKVSIDNSLFDGVVNTPVKKIVVTSTTHIPALELLNETHSLIGFPGLDYISSEKTRALINKGLVRELGKNENINTEVLIDVAPELVIGFGIDGNNKTFENIRKAGIPVIYNGEWVETSPLAKAEWIKFFGVLYDKQEMADSIFKKIESDYLNAKEIAKDAVTSPKVLSGALYKDVWYLPSGTSPEAQLLKDANTNYVYSYTTDKGSLSLNFENVLEKAQDADIWISPSYYPSMESLEKANAHYTQFKAFQNKEIYSFVNTTGATGGVTYFEMGMARPDLVLQDLIKIMHPELLVDYETVFFQRLQ